MINDNDDKNKNDQADERGSLPTCALIRFRPDDQPRTAQSRIDDLRQDELVMVQTDHGLEPALVVNGFHPCGFVGKQSSGDPSNGKQSCSYRSMGKRPMGRQQGTSTGGGRDSVHAKTGIPLVFRRAEREELAKYRNLQIREREDFLSGRQLIAKHDLPMKLIKVERFFNGSKIIFYFTAENRVDFRELVKDMVQKFRTRIEIRQVGVRHETKMLGGIGCCGRELCCNSFIRNFAPVSIKMAKEQGLALNPAKISGVCNRLLCCLTYEFSTYQQLRRQMPKPGKIVTLDGRDFKVLKVNILEETLEVNTPDDPEQVITWQRHEWQRCEPDKSRGKTQTTREREKKTLDRIKS
ncbi:MAG: hypothetical protein EYX74_03110 [Desulfobulbaceae bacterium]|nr:MAG: hypothetical protein EYX74_03110 [Desulfobulbaceae bacterium]